MRTLALTDGLTGVMNRRAITDLAARELARARRGETPVAFMLLDVDHFKRINDTHGHPAGDAVLAQLVQRLRDAMRDYDTIGRWGGEEFLLVLPGLSLAHQEGRRRAENLRRCVAGQPFDIGTGTPLAVTCSAGVVAVPAGAGETLEAVIARADAALYDAKRGGRDRAVFAA
jgi:diguanylate cyclase (GGDEF)-like protein